MIEGVFALHTITAENKLSFPFPIREYQQYVFGDGRLAQQYGTDLAKAFIDHWSGSKLNSTPTHNDNTLEQHLENNFVVAAVAGPIPTATTFLRKHFTTELNRHLTSIQRPCAFEVDLHLTENDYIVSSSQKPKTSDDCQTKSVIAQAERFLIISDLRATAMEESAIKASLKSHGITTPPTFLYLIIDADASAETVLLPTLSRIVNPSIRDIEATSQSSSFNMNESFIHYVLQQDYTTFCRFVRLQDDGIVRLLLDLVRKAEHHDDETSRQNLAFLKWEVNVRNEI